MSQIAEILISLGYRLRDEGKWYRAAAVYRGGTNQSCLSINKESGGYQDWKTGETGSFKDLVYRTDPENAERLLGDFDPNAFSLSVVQPEIPKLISYDRSILAKLMPKWDLYLEDGISEETMRTFEVGFKEDGHLFRRYCFPIYNVKGRIIGFSGRYEHKIVPERNPPIAKWKHHGKKMEWLWPVHVNAFDIARAREVILVESANDVFHLWEAGIKNAICLFGVIISPVVFKFLLQSDLDHIIIATNNDSSENKFAGQRAAEKIWEALSMFFSTENTLRISLPTKKDFGVMTKEEILAWYDKRLEINL